MQKRRVKRHSVTQPSDPSYRLIPLTRNQNAKVDTRDYDWLSQFNWYAQWNDHTRSFYANRRDGNAHVKMHSAILGISSTRINQVDHRNADTLDNRRSNLRRATPSQNKRNCRKRRDNTTGYVGVYLRQKSGRYRAILTKCGERICLGEFISAKEAARAYNEAAKKLHGEFAHLNHI